MARFRLASRLCRCRWASERQGEQGGQVATPAPPRAWSGKRTMTSVRGLVLAEQLQAMALPDLGILASQGSHPMVYLVSWESK